MIASKSNPDSVAESGEGSQERTRMGGEYVKGTARVQHARRVKYANRVALMSRAAEATGELATGRCKHCLRAYPRTCRRWRT